MRSERPKPLHRLCGRPMVLHVLHALGELPLDRAVVVVGHGGERVTKAVAEQPPSDLRIEFVEQRVQRGTGDAVSVAMTAFDDDLDDVAERRCRAEPGEDVATGVVVCRHGPDAYRPDLQHFSGADLDDVEVTQESQRPNCVPGTSGHHDGDSMGYLTQ